VAFSHKGAGMADGGDGPKKKSGAPRILAVRRAPQVSQGGSFAHPARHHEHPVVAPQVLHLRQVPLRTSVKFPHSPHESPS